MPRKSLATAFSSTLSSILRAVPPRRLPALLAGLGVVDPSVQGRIFLGTDLGVFVSLDEGLTWATENTGFANAVTESLALREDRDGSFELFAFTHGRGAWKVPLEGPSDGRLRAHRLVGP